MLDKNVETLTLKSEKKYNKKYEKLLPVRVEDNIIIYYVKYDGSKIKKLINKINNKYTINVDDYINTSFIDKTPLSMGEYDKNPYSVVKNYKVLKHEENVNKYDRFITDLYFPNDGYGKIKINVDIYPALSGILEDTFLTPNEYVLLNLTDLLKYRNYIYGVFNNFVFDKTIDIPKKNLAYKKRIENFPSILDYNRYINDLKYNLNENKLFLNDKEKRKIRNDIHDLVKELQNIMEYEDIAMFPIESFDEATRENITKKVLTRYGDRNMTCNYIIRDVKWLGWFGAKLEYAKSINDTKIYNNLTKDIVFHYDIDGVDYEKRSIKNNINNKSIKHISKIKKAQ